MFIGSECIVQVYLSLVSFMKHIIEVFPQAANSRLLHTTGTVSFGDWRSVITRFGQSSANCRELCELGQLEKIVGHLQGRPPTRRHPTNSCQRHWVQTHAYAKLLDLWITSGQYMSQTWKTPLNMFDHCGWPQTSHLSLSQTVSISWIFMESS